MGVTLAIDPGRCTGWCYLVDGRVADCGVANIEPYSATVVDHSIYQPNRLLCELPEIYKSGEANPNISLTPLIVQVGRFIQYYMSVYRASCGTVLPKEWKGQMSKSVCRARIYLLLDERERKIVEARERSMSATRAHNMIDAVGIGLHAVGRKLTGR